MQQKQERNFSVAWCRFIAAHCTAWPDTIKMAVRCDTRGPEHLGSKVHDGVDLVFVQDEADQVRALDVALDELRNSSKDFRRRAAGARFKLLTAS